jgi:hypothetical protein
MASTLHIIANCADTKRAVIPKLLRLGSLRTASVNHRAIQWWNRLAKYNGEPIPALKLYAGDHWAIVKSLPVLAGDFGYRSKLWVISAGYGLVPSEALLHPYSATFTSGHPDSVARSSGEVTGDALSLWWETLSKFPGPDPEQPHSLKDLLITARNARFLIVASPPYLRAIEKDLLSAFGTIAKPDRILVITSRDGLRTKLNGNVIRSDARLQASLGGARVSLNARVAAMIIMNSGIWGFDPPTLAKKLNRLVANSPTLPNYDRQPMNDEEVKRFIWKSLNQDSTVSCTSLLRTLRNSQRACEQKRFKGLYWSVKDELS